MSAICFPEPEREPLPLRHSSPNVPDTGLSIEASPVYSNLSSPDDGHLNGDVPPRSGSAAAPTSGSESIASPKLNGKPLGLDEDEPDDQPPCLAPADEYNEGKTLLRPMESPPEDPPVINGLGSETDHLLGSHTPASMVAAISLASNMTSPNGRNVVMGLTSITPSPSSPKIQSQAIVKVKQQRQQPATGKVHWSVERTSVLLDLIETHIDRFGSSRTQRPLWKEIATKFCARFSISIDDVNGDHCYNKWKNLRRDLRDQRHSEKATRNPSIMSKVASLEALMMSRGGPHHGGGRNGLVSGNSQVDPLVNSASLLDIKVAIKELKQECMRDNLASSPLIRNRNSYSSSASAPPQPHAPPKKRPRRDLIADLPLVPNAASTTIQQQHQLQQQLHQQQHEQLQQQQIQQLEHHHLSVGARPSPPQDSSSPPETYSLDNACGQQVVKREESPATDLKHSPFEHQQQPQPHVHHPASVQSISTVSNSQSSPDQTFGLTPDLLMQIFHGVIPGAQSANAPPSQHSPQPPQQQSQHDPNFLSQHIVPTILNSLAVLSGGANSGSTSTPTVSQESLMAAAVALMSPSNSAPPQPPQHQRGDVSESQWHRMLVAELGRWREMEESHERAREKMRLERRELKDRHEGLKRRMSEEKRNIQSRIFQVVVMGESLPLMSANGAGPGSRQQP